jgi:inner membrane protein
MPPLSWRSAAVWSALSLLPDLDAVGFAIGIPYGAPLGHRGAAHSLFVALVIGAVAAAWAPRLRLPRARIGIYVALVVASHGLLDAMTDGGKGIALGWPFSTARVFFPWRPIPVAPIGLGLLSARGFEVMFTELLYFAPVLVWGAWPLLQRPTGEAPEREPERVSDARPDEVVVAEIEDSIDLHTFAPRDVASVVDEYLREARARGFTEVRVVHGKGKGVQRRIVEGVLARHPDVASWRVAPGHRGGWGATLVVLKRSKPGR